MPLTRTGALRWIGPRIPKRYATFVDLTAIRAPKRACPDTDLSGNRAGWYSYDFLDNRSPTERYPYRARAAKSKDWNGLFGAARCDGRLYAAILRSRTLPRARVESSG